MAGTEPAVTKGRPRTTWADVVVPLVFDRWEVATRGTASAMRNAKSRIVRGEYGEGMEAMVAFDRETDRHVLLVRKRRDDPWYGQLAPTTNSQPD